MRSFTNPVRSSGVISESRHRFLLSMVEDRSTLEVGVVGAEGMVGISVFLGAQASLNQALVQAPARP